MVSFNRFFLQEQKHNKRLIDYKNFNATFFLELIKSDAEAESRGKYTFYPVEKAEYYNHMGLHKRNSP